MKMASHRGRREEEEAAEREAYTRERRGEERRERGTLVNDRGRRCGPFSMSPSRAAGSPCTRSSFSSPGAVDVPLSLCSQWAHALSVCRGRFKWGPRSGWGLARGAVATRDVAAPVWLDAGPAGAVGAELPYYVGYPITATRTQSAVVIGCQCFVVLISGDIIKLSILILSFS